MNDTSMNDASKMASTPLEHVVKHFPRNERWDMTKERYFGLVTSRPREWIQLNARHHDSGSTRPVTRAS
ncbi:hypothetical protein PC116_g26899 [Phytophthora cactorum]|nr:hypothetical protein PC114_g25966 [Phytophthora cactorum]KAG3139945.1 hypothetical protein PC128_g25285 [Phytophthora cactorum]KAG4224655.1 hypothetical protein PC116_g26899 [Phytophthora cactorum]